MDLALMIAKSGLEAQHESIEVISNNLANADTTAFKKNRPEFEDLPYQVETQPGSPASQDINAPGSIIIGTGTKLSNNKKIFTQGSPIQTGNPLDVAINGRGFLQVQLSNGSDVAYTRAGNLTINDQGQITMPNGFVVQPPITIPQNAVISIAQDGTVSATTPGTTAPQQIGQLQLYDFVNPDGLEPIGQNLYTETTGSGTATQGIAGQNGYGVLTQYATEGSNVNVVEEMVNLIEAQRAFEVTSKAVSAIDNMLGELNQTT